ncbi:unnamed protein product [Absidia cylindrospora]
MLVLINYLLRTEVFEFYQERSFPLTLGCRVILKTVVCRTMKKKQTLILEFLWSDDNETGEYDSYYDKTQ